MSLSCSFDACGDQSVAGRYKSWDNNVYGKCGKAKAHAGKRLAPQVGSNPPATYTLVAGKELRNKFNDFVIMAAAFSRDIVEEKVMNTNSRLTEVIRCLEDLVHLIRKDLDSLEQGSG
jgi:hypothetical protein